MKTEDLLRAIGQASPAMLEEMERSVQHKRRRAAWVVAACLLLLLCGAALLSMRLRVPVQDLQPEQLQGDGSAAAPDDGEKNPENPQEQTPPLPKLTVQPQQEGLGITAVYVFSPEELCSDTAAEFSSLPVYRNTSPSPLGDANPGIGEEAMRRLLEAAAQALDITLGTPETQLREDGTAAAMSAYAAGVQLCARAGGSLEVWFDEPVVLPEEIHFSNSAEPENAEKTAAYLAGRYSTLLGFETPVPDLRCDYNIYGNRLWTWSVYDGAGMEEEQFLGRNFSNAVFYPDETGALVGLRCFRRLSCAEKIGDYPLISEEEARTLLAAGRYQTTCPEPFAGTEAIGGVELVYSCSGADETFLPYYRFWARLPQTEAETEILADGLQIYGAYDVPAVSDAYLDWSEE